MPTGRPGAGVGYAGTAAAAVRLVVVDPGWQSVCHVIVGSQRSWRSAWSQGTFILLAASPVAAGTIDLNSSRLDVIYPSNKS